MGDGEQSDGADRIHFFEIPDVPASTPQTNDQAAGSLKPIGRGDKSFRGEGNYFGLLVHESRLLATSHGDDSKGWVCQTALENGLPKGDFEPWIDTKTHANVDGLG